MSPQSSLFLVRCPVPTAISRYERGVARQSKATDNLQRLLDRHPHLLSEIEVEKEDTAT
ncbi:MAG: type II toxin-antitoxin system MqsA family antitoxin [Bdellovibrionales bacterium]|nr:type II toxin-antitoxin system MqsA family antitoxin [Bdellovibrionales bacterium]